MAAGLLKGTFKVGIGIGAIYITAVEGVWSQSKQSSLALRKLTNSISEQDSYLSSQMPNKNNVSKLMLEKWNSGVQWSFNGLASLPNRVSQMAVTTANKITGYVK